VPALQGYNLTIEPGQYVYMVTTKWKCTHHVKVALARVEFDGKATRVAQGLRGATLVNLYVRA
jgi:hypothetical protein